MLPDGAIGEQFVAFDDDLADGRKVKWIDDLEAGRELPNEEKTDDADDAEPVGENFPGALPQPIGGQRIRFVDGDEIEGFWLLIRRGTLLGDSVRLNLVVAVSAVKRARWENRDARSHNGNLQLAVAPFGATPSVSSR